MATTLTRGATTSIAVGGTSVVAVYGGVQGAIIWNPLTAVDQGVVGAETLFVDPTKPAVLFANTTCVALAPGQFYFVQGGDASNVWVNALKSGHKFTCIVMQPAVQFPPVPIVGVFPPIGPTGLTTSLPSYLYQQYTDDDSLQAFITAYNAMTQNYVDWFNSINLPIYTQSQIYGLLLDWVAAGIYGYPRPVLSTGRQKWDGPFNTLFLNQRVAINKIQRVGALRVIDVTDDVFKRMITWHFFKGDGKYLDTRWLKRRIGRFLFGANGTDYNGNTYQISITHGDEGELSITILSGLRTVTRAFVCNFIPGLPNSGSYLNKIFQVSPNFFSSTFTAYAIPALAKIFQIAINTGALEMPLQYYPVSVQIYPRGTVRGP